MKKKMRNEMQKNNSTFNGSTTNSNMNGVITYPFENQHMNDSITYCPFCGKHLTMDTDEIKYCPFCGRAIPRTCTGNFYIIHWNLLDRTATWPRDGIIYPYTTC